MESHIHTKETFQPIVYFTVLLKGLLIRKVISKSNTLSKVLLFLQYKYELPYPILNKYYFSSANRLPRKSTGHEVSTSMWTRAQGTTPGPLPGHQPADSHLPETWRPRVKDQKPLEICSQKDSLKFHQIKESFSTAM